MKELIKHLENMKSALQLAKAIGEIYAPAKLNFEMAIDEAIRMAKLQTTNFEQVQTELNKNFSNIRMSAEHTLFLNERFDVINKQTP